MVSTLFVCVSTIERKVEMYCSIEFVKIDGFYRFIVRVPGLQFERVLANFMDLKRAIGVALHRLLSRKELYCILTMLEATKPFPMGG